MTLGDPVAATPPQFNGSPILLQLLFSTITVELPDEPVPGWHGLPQQCVGYASPFR